VFEILTLKGNCCPFAVYIVICLSVYRSCVSVLVLVLLPPALSLFNVVSKLQDCELWVAFGEMKISSVLKAIISFRNFNGREPTHGHQLVYHPRIKHRL
jgi:hypothetical protein